MVWQNSNAFTLVSLAALGSISGGSAGTLPDTGALVTLVSLADISQFQSYDLAVNVYNVNQATTAGIPLTFNIQLTWYDDTASGIPVFTETWHPWVLNQTVPSTDHSVKHYGVTGTGPMHGHYLTVTASIPGGSTTQAATVQYFNLFGSPRNTAVSDWRQAIFGRVKDTAYSSISTTLGMYDGQDNILGTTAGHFAVTASTNYIMPLALYAGPARVSLHYIGSTVITAAALVDIGSEDTSTGNIDNTQSQIVFFPTTAGGESEVQYIAPRSACALLIQIGTTGGSISVYCDGQQGP